MGGEKEKPALLLYVWSISWAQKNREHQDGGGCRVPKESPSSSQCRWPYLKHRFAAVTCFHLRVVESIV